jgi:hypothetical protein
MDNYTIEDTTSLPIIPRSLAGDMRFVGWFAIIQGGLACLSIIGALIGVPILISGLRLKEAADELDSYQRNGSTAELTKALERQSRYFFIQKVILIVALVLAVLYIIFFFTFFLSFLQHGGFKEMMERRSV